tara:strand:+ start:415 stop:1995 length:1581 start_codon:yes stop_codon:yes gene_type:complete
MSNFIKIQANQSTISESQNLIDFQIPSYLKGVDMSKSFLNINFTITEDPSAAGADAIHNYALKFNGLGENGELAAPNSALIRHAYLSSSKAGQLEAIRRADLFSTVKEHYTSNIGDTYGDQSKSIYQLPEWGNAASAAGARNLITDGSVYSTNVQSAMRVDLKDIFGLGSSVVNLEQTGDLRIHLEANLNKFTLVPLPVAVSGVSTAGHNGYFQVRNVNLATGTAPTVITVGQEGAANVTGKNMFLDRKNCPYHVGCEITVSGVTPTVTPASQNTIIQSMTWIEQLEGGAVAGQVVELGLNRSFMSGNIDTTNLLAFNIGIQPPVNPKLNYVSAELVLATTSSPPVSKGLMYRTVNTIEDHVAATTNYQGIYHLPSNAIANLVCFDTTSTSTEFSNSYDPTIQSYQQFVDNEPVTDRPVLINSTDANGRQRDSLHGIILEKTLDEMGLEFKNYTESIPQPLIDAGDNSNPQMQTVIPDLTAHKGILALPAILPATNAQKMLQLNISKATGSMNLVLFQSIERMITF